MDTWYAVDSLIYSSAVSCHLIAVPSAYLYMLSLPVFTNKTCDARALKLKLNLLSRHWPWKKRGCRRAVNGTNLLLPG